MPPLDYDLVYRVKREHPAADHRPQWRHRDAGGGRSASDHVDGVMLGRAAYQIRHADEIDARFFGDEPRDLEEAVADT